MKYLIEFEKRKYTEIYKTLSEFNNAYYHYQEVDDDFGYYDVDFDANYLYGHSYLTLSELRKKDKIGYHHRQRSRNLLVIRDRCNDRSY